MCEYEVELVSATAMQEVDGLDLLCGWGIPRQEILPFTLQIPTQIDQGNSSGVKPGISCAIIDAFFN